MSQGAARPGSDSAEAARRALRAAFPSMPEGLEAQIVADSLSRHGSNCVWFVTRLPEWARTEALATAWVRHRETRYDGLLPRARDPHYRSNRVARALVEPRVRAVLDQWRRPPGG